MKRPVMSKRNSRTYNVLYLVQNIVNGKVYVGVHCTDDINDDYIGSGIVLRKAIGKYGKNSFIKTIIAHYPTAEDAYKAEAQMVDSLLVKSNWTYNSTTGGIGGRNAGFKHSEETKLKLRSKAKNRVCDTETRLKISQSLKGGRRNTRKVICLQTNKVFDCVKDCSKEIGIGLSTLRYRIEHNKCNYKYA